MSHFQFIIVGGGLAGTTLAWRLIEQGGKVLIVDRGDRHTPSRLAAGLITPITGKRLAISERWDDYWPAAETFYRRVESELAAKLLSTAPPMRFFDSPAEAQVFQHRQSDPNFSRLTRPLDDAAIPPGLAAPYGGLEMTAGGRLDVAKYLDGSHRWFTERSALTVGEVGLDDCQFVDQRVQIQSLGVTARQIIFCRGLGDQQDFAGGLCFEPVKGEMLTIRVRGVQEAPQLGGANLPGVWHRGVWMAEVDRDLYRVGATYDRDNIDNEPTAAGRQSLEEKLLRLLSLPYEVVGHVAAVRPVLAGRRPVGKLLPHQPQIGVFNGLGSKGALWAPLVAEKLASGLLAPSS